MRNEHIIFDRVRVVDTTGNFIGDMNTPEATQLAKSKGMNLFLINFNSKPPVCQIAHQPSTPPDEGDESATAEISGFSFDPSRREMTIEITTQIAMEALEMKMDILRKHLLQKSRCEIVVLDKYHRSTRKDLSELFSRVVNEVNDIAKPASDINMDHPSVPGEYRLKIWPCSPEQAESLDMGALVGKGPPEPTVTHISELNETRVTRRSRDPKIQNRYKPSKRLGDD